MAEKTILVCDICGRPATETVSFKFGGATLQKDYCDEHLAELTDGARRPRRGRRPGTTAASPRRKKTAGRKKAATRKRATRRRRPGRPRKTQAAEKAPAEKARSEAPSEAAGQ